MPSHSLAIYGAHLHICTDRRQWATLRRRFKDLTIPDSEGAVYLTFDGVKNRVPHLCIYLDRASVADDKTLVNLVAHEATHAAGALFDHLGEKYDGESEALAYLVGWIAECAWEACG